MFYELNLDSQKGFSISELKISIFFKISFESNTIFIKNCSRAATPHQNSSILLIFKSLLKTTLISSKSSIIRNFLLKSPRIFLFKTLFKAC